jgi:hypothetical protein
MEGFFDGDLTHYEQATAMWQAAIGESNPKVYLSITQVDGAPSIS